MIVLDAYAVLAYLRGERAAVDVAALLRSPTTVSAVNAAEVVDQLVRVWGRNLDDVQADLALLSLTGMRIAAVTEGVAIVAGRLRASYYHRERLAVSLADCIAAATALSEHAPLATSDPALAAMLRAAGGEVTALPDTAGRLP